MKGIYGLLLAAGLGVLAALCNWYYLDQAGREFDRVDFVGLSDDVELHPGEKFQESHFVPASVPRRFARRLEASAYRWDVRDTLYGIPAAREFLGGEILLRQDVQTPPQKLPDEDLVFVPIDSQRVVAALITPGDQVSFILPRQGAFPTPADGSRGAAQDLPTGGLTELIGPFRVLSIGSRLGSSDVHRAAGRSSAQETVMGIGVKVANGELEASAQKLIDRLTLVARPVGIVRHVQKK